MPAERQSAEAPYEHPGRRLDAPLYRAAPVGVPNDSRSSEKFMHGIRVLMAKNDIDNLSEEVRKGMREKAEQGHWPPSRTSAT